MAHLTPRLIIFGSIVPVCACLGCPVVESGLLAFGHLLAILTQDVHVISQIELFWNHNLSAVAEWKLFRQFINCGL